MDETVIKAVFRAGGDKPRWGADSGGDISVDEQFGWSSRGGTDG